jgi:hypothetical protein
MKAKFQRLSRAAAEVGRQEFKGDLLSLSIGCAAYPDDGADAEALLAEADPPDVQGEAVTRPARGPNLGSRLANRHGIVRVKAV